MKQPRCRDERGDSLVEIVFAIVLIGIVSAGFFTAVMTSQTASKSHREAVTADGMLRDYAEATKQAVRDKPCDAAHAGTSYTVPYTAPTGYTIAAVSASGPTGPSGATGPLLCPQTNTVNRVDITATTPVGIAKTLRIEVRTP